MALQIGFLASKLSETSMDVEFDLLIGRLVDGPFIHIPSKPEMPSWLLSNAETFLMLRRSVTFRSLL